MIFKLNSCNTFLKRFDLIVRYKSKITNKSNDFTTTLNLPNAGKFELSMKKICENEEHIKKLANFDSLYEWQRRNRSDRPLFVLHDGPPYANGDIHIGHMVNKVLKDVYLRYKLLSGYQISYKPGWDCHGLPIELSAIKSLKKSSAKQKDATVIKYNKSDPLDVRRNANQYALSCINIQMKSFKKMNLLADWSNVYRTIDTNYMCNELDLFYDLYEKGLIYRNYMPVYWSVSSQTALAESELEYNQNHKSNALYVAFEMRDYPSEIKNLLRPNQKLYAPIWTTTIWSLPCNKAIAFNSNLKYGLVEVDENKVYLIEKNLMDYVRENVPYFTNSKILNSELFNGNILVGSTYTSPFLQDKIEVLPLLHSDHVTSKTGTGFCHIAPALGQDDFKLGIKHNLETKCSIDELGKYVNDDEILKSHELSGMPALDNETSKKIKSILSKFVLHEHVYTHSYPYDWRTKKPCIIRSSLQWFIDTNKLKDESLKALKDVRIRPNNVSNSMTTSLSSRPYWCISRQRSWGLPIPCLYDKNDKAKKNALLNKELIENMKRLIRSDGNVDFWWSEKYDQNLTGSLNHLNKNYLIKSTDIFDIWFDSGSSFNCVLKEEQSEKLADLYCEGVDQFSGWFQSSLLLSIAQRNKTPYKNLLVHGFVVDESNRKMSKSIGNVIEPEQAIKGVPNKLPQAGLDVLRFWVTHEYYKPQIQIGPQIIDKFIKRVFEIRSILRFIVGNLNDLDNNKKIDLINYENMMPIDKFILNRLNDLLDDVVTNYDDFNLSKSLLTIENFFLTQLSSFYIKSVKDRLYCERKDSLKRRSAQSALYHVLTKSLVMLGPVLPHLTEEAFYYSILKSNKNDETQTLFRTELNLNKNQDWNDKTIDDLFEIIDKMRNKFYEQIQSDNSATYDIKLECNQILFSWLEKHSKQWDNDLEWLNECFGSSKLQITQSLSLDQSLNDPFLLKIEKISDKKHVCPRCRKYNSQTKNSLCDRCNKIISN